MTGMSKEDHQVLDAREALRAKDRYDATHEWVEPGLNGLVPDPDRIKLWVAALLSDDYEQGHDQLVDDQGNYCCLAVATAVAIEQGLDAVSIIDNVVTMTRDYDQDANRWIHHPNNDHNEQMPRIVAQWYGLANTNPVLDGLRAIVRNDGEKQDFATIAEAITKQFLTKEEGITE